MKQWLIFVALICFSTTAAHAGQYNTTCSVVSISTSIPTEITHNISTNTATTPPASVWSVKVVNLDTSADLFSSQDVAVSSFSTHQGDNIAHAAAAPWNWIAWIINSSKNWYVISNGTSATRALVCLTQ